MNQVKRIGLASMTLAGLSSYLFLKGPNQDIYSGIGLQG